MKESFKEDVVLLKNKIELKEKLEEYLKQKKQEFENSVKDLKEEIKQISENIDIMFESIDEEVLFDHKKTKETKYFGGFKIKNYKSVTYDFDVAFNWAKEKDMFLTLDKKAFDKACESLNLEFIKIDTNPKVIHPKIIKLEE